ncbi:Wzz/FepE/Etk N-terminal domain-containing protein [Arthrobacter pityocampae]|uniref:Wzz/FepE/Etk N-terminal domain-containing protein n=1 Tax=Arthrobacter pityocampae TaxID=547334 RepID=UPI00142D35C4|nr:Wzz/FepE/Etk N-terminal domain-containing protein [Arthrobacter pityocampae]
MELIEYGRIFRRRWLLILAATICGVMAAVVVTGLATPRFDARAALFIRADSESSSSFENSQFVLQRVKSYPDLVDSPQVLTPVLQELKSSETLAELRERVSATNPAETVYVEVTASAGTAEEAATLANLVAANLRDVIRQLEGGDTVRNAAVEAFVTEPAVAPESVAAPNSVLNLAIGLLVGLAAGLVGALVLGGAPRRVQGSADMPRSFDTRLIGSVDTGGARAGAAVSAETELQYRGLLTALLLRRSGQLPRLLLLTVVGQHDDGHDTVGHEFASFIGDSGARTCSIDSTRATPPGRTGSSSEDPEPGFSEVLLGEAALHDVVSVIEDGALCRIPIGSSVDRITRSRASRQSASLLKELSDDFDVTVVTTSSTSHPLATSTVAPVCEAVLVLVTYGTPVRTLEDALRELQAVGVEPVGVVLLRGPRRSGRRATGSGRVKVRAPDRE